ncbi:MAG TPA: YEATS-associated helix-containing protein [Clostridia bacterium]|nr:YEATS-associated helix-containing protein [Clostridia bacterium]
MAFYLIIVPIIIASGSFGGCISYFLHEKKTSNIYDLAKSMMFGIAAAFIVPLFLNLISSNLMDMDEMDTKKLLEFTGICLLLSIYSKPFLKTMSSKVLKQLQEQSDETNKKLNAVINALISKEGLDTNTKTKTNTDGKGNAKNEGQSAANSTPDKNNITEGTVKNSMKKSAFKKVMPDCVDISFNVSEEMPEDDANTNDALKEMPEDDANTNDVLKEVHAEDDANTKIIKAVGISGYTFMTADRFASETNLTKWQVGNILEDLINKGLVAELPQDNKIFYFLTVNGKMELEKLNQ